MQMKEIIFPKRTRLHCLLAKSEGKEKNRLGFSAFLIAKVNAKFLKVGKLKRLCYKYCFLFGVDSHF